MSDEPENPDTDGEGESEKLDYEAVVSLDDALKHLSSLLHGLALQKLSVESGEKKVTLTPHSVVKLEVEAKSDGRRQKLEFELEWELPPRDGGLRIVVEDEDVDAGALEVGANDASD